MAGTNDTKKVISCNEFATWNNVDTFFKLLKNNSNALDFDGILEVCKYEICPTVYGAGNPDICGVGLMAAFLIELVFGFLFGCLICAYLPLLRCPRLGSSNTLGSDEKSREKQRKTIINLMTIFFDTSFIFCASIIVVSFIFGVRKDTNIGTSGLGAFDFEIAASVCLCTLLPLLYPLILLPIPQIYDSEFLWRLGKILVCAGLYFYIFYMRFSNAFRKEENTEVLSNEEIIKLAQTCIPQSTISEKDGKLMKAFGLLGSLVFYIIGITYVLYILLRGSNNEKPWVVLTRVQKWVRWTRFHLRLLFYGTIFVAVPLLCVGQIWTIIRLRGEQQAVVTKQEKAGNQVGEWGFGQVIAICMWFPVFLEMFKLVTASGILAQRGRKYRKEEACPTAEATSA